MAFGARAPVAVAPAGGSPRKTAATVALAQAAQTHEAAEQQRTAVAANRGQD